MTPVHMPCIPPTSAPILGNTAQESEIRHVDAEERHKRNYPTTFLTQFLCLLRRTFLLILRDKVCLFQNILLVPKQTAMHNINQLLSSDIVIIFEVAFIVVQKYNTHSHTLSRTYFLQFSKILFRWKISKSNFKS